MNPRRSWIGVGLGRDLKCVDGGGGAEEALEEEEEQ